MYSDTYYYFSKWTFLFTTVFIISGCTGIIYTSMIFYPTEWKYSIILALPLLLFLSILPEYIRSFYFLLTKKPVLILTKEKLIDNFKQKEYRWAEIIKIEYTFNEGSKAPGGYIAVHLKDLKSIRIPDIRLRGKRADLIRTLNRYNDKYKKSGV